MHYLKCISSKFILIVRSRKNWCKWQQIEPARYKLKWTFACKLLPELLPPTGSKHSVFRDLLHLNIYSKPKTSGCTQRAHTYYTKYASGIPNPFEFTFKYARAASEDGHIWGGIVAAVKQSCAITVCSGFERRP